MATRLQFRRFRLPFRQPVRTAHGVLAQREGVLVRLEDDAGRTGFGEAAPLPGFSRESVEQVVAACEAFAGGALPEGATTGLAHVPTLAAAIAAAEEDITAWRGAIGANEYRAVAALLPAGRGAIERLRTQASAGFRTFKWKVGVGDADEEMGWLDELCAVLPEGGRLRLDANGAWDRRRAERWLARCADRPVEYVEQPIAAAARGADDLLLGLAADYPTPLALDESLVRDADADRWLAAGWRGCYVAKTSLLADPAAVLDKLAAAGARVVFSSALETAVGARAALRFAFHWPGERLAVGFGVWPLFAAPGCDGPAAAPFVRWSDVSKINPEETWNALG